MHSLQNVLQRQNYLLNLRIPLLLLPMSLPHPPFGKRRRWVVLAASHFGFSSEHCHRQCWRSLSPLHKSMCWNLIPHVLVFGGRAFGKWLGYERGAFMNEISVLLSETPESSLAPSTTWGHSQKSAACSREDSSHQNLTMLIASSDFQPPNYEKTFLLFLSCPVCGTSLERPEHTETVLKRVSESFLPETKGRQEVSN